MKKIRVVHIVTSLALNCTFNDKLAQRRLFDETYVQPAPAYRR